MIKPKFKDFDYGEGRKDLSWLQYAKALEEYVTFLEAQEPAFRQPPIAEQSEQLCQHDRSVTNRICDDCGSVIIYVPDDELA